MAILQYVRQEAEKAIFKSESGDFYQVKVHVLSAGEPDPFPVAYLGEKADQWVLGSGDALTSKHPYLTRAMDMQKNTARQNIFKRLEASPDVIYKGQLDELEPYLS